MASPGNSIRIMFHNNLHYSAEETLTKLREAKLSKWTYTQNAPDYLGDWVHYDKWHIRLTILDGKVSSSNVLTDGQREEGSKEYVINVLCNYLSDLKESNPEINASICDSDPV